LGTTPIRKNGSHDIWTLAELQKGAAPIEKNVIVTDAEGKEIGSTWPKRAKGLVKNGRAEYVGDREIRLLFTQAPTVYSFTEELNMSKVIEFNARDFRLDKTVSNGFGERVFLTTGPGSTVEAWEMGDYGKVLTRIAAEKKLEKNTDYLFRFAMTGGINAVLPGNVESKAVLYGLDGYETEEEAWEERLTFSLAESRFRPVLSKRDKTGLLRVFELPFHTGEQENWRIVFTAMGAPAQFFPAEDMAAYEPLTDLSYDVWLEERKAEQEERIEKEVVRQMKKNSFLWPENGKREEKDEEEE
jgi:hypothetical protein